MWKTWIFCSIFLPVFVSSQCNPGSVYNDNNKCFTFFPAQVDFKTAESICLMSNGHLASVHNTIDNNFIAKQAQKYVSANSAIWLGAKSYSSNLNDQKSWNWTDGSAFDYQNYQSGQPGTLETQACMKLSPSTGKWSTASCTNYAPFICEYALTTPSTCAPNNHITCRSGYYYSAVTQSCYKVVIAAVDWDTAHSQCLSDGGSLASVHSYYENNFLTNRCKTGLSVNKHLSIFIGLQILNKDNCAHNRTSNFEWTDGTNVNYVNWAHGEPNNCGNEYWTAIMPDPIDKGYDPDGGEWNNVEKNKNRGFICQLPLEKH